MSTDTNTGVDTALQEPGQDAGTLAQELAVGAPESRNAVGQFAKGTSGNPGGKPKGKDLFSAQLRAVLAELDEDGKTNAQLIAEAMVTLAKRGNVQAAQLIGDRVEGKPAQALTLKGDDSAPLHVLATARYEGWASPQQLPQPAEPTLPPPTPPTTPPEAEPGPEGAGDEG